MTETAETSMALIDRIKYDGPPDVLVWKYPKDNITLGAQLIVNESQDALFFRGGQALDLFPPGTYTLSTNNLPLLQKLVDLPFGGQTPFSAEVYFTNRVARLDYKWGTRTPISVEDPKYGVLLNIGCFGQFGLRVLDSRTLITQLVGTSSSWDANSVLEYFRGVIITRVKDSVAKAVVQKGISVVNINAYVDELSEIAEYRLRDEFAKYGLELLKFFITSINVPDEEIAKLQKGAFARLEIDQLGDARYQMKRSLEVLETAAGNAGTAGSLMAGGIGLGMGTQLGAAFAQAGQSVAPRLNAAPLAPPTPAPASVQPAPSLQPSQATPVLAAGTCASCAAPLAPDAKFCTECGTKVNVARSCAQCGAALIAGSKFCGECGAKV
jgi:membrane protease subunit (stomatin/prohibitin family)